MPQNFAEYITRRHLKPPQRLYKYRSVERALRILNEGVLWWSPPKRFCDLDDCQWNPYDPVLTADAWQAEEAETRRRLEGCDIGMTAIIPNYQSVWEGVRRRLKELPCDRRAATIDEMLNQNRNQFEGTQVQYAERLEETIQRLRVLCLCAEANSDRMWDEYAATQRGCLLAFDTSALERAWKVLTSPPNPDPGP